MSGIGLLEDTPGLSARGECEDLPPLQRRPSRASPSQHTRTLTAASARFHIRVAPVKSVCEDPARNPDSHAPPRSHPM